MKQAAELPPLINPFVVVLPSIRPSESIDTKFSKAEDLSSLDLRVRCTKYGERSGRSKNGRSLLIVGSRIDILGTAYR